MSALRATALFWEQCEHRAEEEETGWTSAVVDLWSRVVSFLPGSQDGEKGHPTSGDDPLPPPCHAPVMEILSHIVLVSIAVDLSAFTATAALFCDSTLSIVKITVHEGKYIIATFFDTSSRLFWVVAESLQSGFNIVWLYASTIIENVVTIIPDGFRTVFVLVCFVLSAVFMCWRRRRRRPVRTKPRYRYTTRATSYRPGYVSKKNSFDSSDTTTPVTRRGKNFPAETIPRLEEDSVEGWIPPPGGGCVGQGPHRCADGERMGSGRGLVWWVVRVVVLLLCLSLPWEFYHLYQLAVANKAAVASAGIPMECSTEPQSWFQTFAHWLSRQLAWSHGNPCDLYFQAIFVDPLWEITPIMVLTSMVTRSLLYPVETLASGLGRALRRFFTHIPLQWQPPCLALLLALLFLLLFFSCRYSFSSMLFRMEPRTPVLGHPPAGEADQHQLHAAAQQRRIDGGALSRRSR
ncbi:hypothetical protein ACOMHN_039404 [Nucella lapillus]